MVSWGYNDLCLRVNSLVNNVRTVFDPMRPDKVRSFFTHIPICISLFSLKVLLIVASCSNDM